MYKYDVVRVSEEEDEKTEKQFTWHSRDADEDLALSDDVMPLARPVRLRVP